jgi:cell division protein FtsB
MHFRRVLCRKVLYLSRHVPTRDDLLLSNRRVSAGVKAARRRRIIQLLLLFVAALLVVNGMVGDRGLLAMLRARHAYDEIAAAIAKQRAENARLREEARRLREDPAAIEELARRQLGLIKPGEKVFIVRDVPPPSSPAAVPH